MPLTEQQRAALQAEAKKRGVDPNKLIAEAEGVVAERDGKQPKGEPTAPGAGEPPKLFMYHLPFVRVREVRQVWLGLTESFPGDEEIASDWAAKHGGGSDGGETPPAAT